jgi:hypothetical protein
VGQILVAALPLVVGSTQLPEFRLTLTPDCSTMTNSCPLRSDDAIAVELMAALEHGDVERLRRLLAAHPELACRVVENAKGGGRTALHLFADWPGHRPNAVAIVQALVEAGADLDAPAVGMWHCETPLHWAASNDDVALIDALLDAGADIERAGSSIYGGSPLSCAVGYGQWAAARRLVERGARTLFWHEAALGLMSAITERVEADPPPQAEQLSGAFLERLPCRAARRRAIPAGARRRPELARPLVGTNTARHRAEGGPERNRGLAARKGRHSGEEKRLTRRPLFRKALLTATSRRQAIFRIRLTRPKVADVLCERALKEIRGEGEAA